MRRERGVGVRKVVGVGRAVGCGGLEEEVGLRVGGGGGDVDREAEVFSRARERGRRRIFARVEVDRRRSSLREELMLNAA